MNAELPVMRRAAGRCLVSCKTESPKAAQKINLARRYFRSHHPVEPFPKATRKWSGPPNIDWPWPRNGRPHASYRFQSGISKFLKRARLVIIEPGQLYHIAAPRSEPFALS